MIEMGMYITAIYLLYSIRYIASTDIWYYSISFNHYMIYYMYAHVKKEDMWFTSHDSIKKNSSNDMLYTNFECMYMTQYTM